MGLTLLFFKYFFDFFLCGYLLVLLLSFCCFAVNGLLYFWYEWFRKIRIAPVGNRDLSFGVFGRFQLHILLQIPHRLNYIILYKFLREVFSNLLEYFETCFLYYCRRHHFWITILPQINLISSILSDSNLALQQPNLSKYNFFPL